MNPTTHQAAADDASPMPTSNVVLVPEELMRAYVMLGRAVEEHLEAGHHYDVMADALAEVHRAAGGGK